MPSYDFSRALRDGITVEDHGERQATLHHLPLGDLVLPTGKIVACDPFVFPETEPFVVEVAPGRYPVVLSVAKFANQSEYYLTIPRVAYAILRLGEGEPVRWEEAALPDDDPMEQLHSFGYPVDAGTGCFMDVTAARIVMHRMEAGNDYNEYLIEAMGQHQPEWANIVVDEATDVNFISFISGFGDGFYASYWGYNTEGAPICLVTDFRVIS